MVNIAGRFLHVRGITDYFQARTDLLGCGRGGDDQVLALYQLSYNLGTKLTGIPNLRLTRLSDDN